MENLPDNLTVFSDDGSTIVNKSNITTTDVFGKKIRTKPQLQSARTQIETLIEKTPNTYYNCSYGSKIEKAKRLSEIEFSDIMKLDKNIHPRLNEITNNINSENIASAVKKNFDTTFDICEQLIDLLNKNKENSADILCHKILNMLSSIFRETFFKDMGQYRNIMTINRLPTLLLFILINLVSFLSLFTHQ